MSLGCQPARLGRVDRRVLTVRRSTSSCLPTLVSASTMSVSEE